MRCEGCLLTITEALQGLPEVIAVESDLEGPRVEADRIRAAIRRDSNGVGRPTSAAAVGAVAPAAMLNSHPVAAQALLGAPAGRPARPAARAR